MGESITTFTSRAMESFVASKNTIAMQTGNFILVFTNSSLLKMKIVLVVINKAAENDEDKISIFFERAS